MNQDLKSLEEQVLALQAEKEVWLQYKNVGGHKDKEQIEHLKDELSGLQKGFEEMAGQCFFFRFHISVLRGKIWSKS